ESLATPPPSASVTADAPIPFSIKRLWFELDEAENRTYSSTNQTADTALEPEEPGDPETVRPSRFPAASPYNQAPYQSKTRRGIGRQLDLLASRLRDSRFSFLFEPGDGLTPDRDGRIGADLET